MNQYRVNQIFMYAVIAACQLLVACGPTSSDPFKNSSIDRGNLSTTDSGKPKEVVKVVDRPVERVVVKEVEKPVPVIVEKVQEKLVYVKGDEIEKPVDRLIRVNPEADVGAKNIISIEGPRNLNFVLGQKAEYKFKVTTIQEADLEFDLVLLELVKGMELRPSPSSSKDSHQREYVLSWTPPVESLKEGDNEVLGSLKIGYDKSQMVVKNTDAKQAERLKTILSNTDYSEEFFYMVRRDLTRPSFKVSGFSGARLEEGNQYPFVVEVKVPPSSGSRQPQPLFYYQSKNMNPNRFEGDANLLFDSQPQKVEDLKSGQWRFTYLLDLKNRRLPEAQKADGEVIPNASSVMVRFATRVLDEGSGLTSDEVVTPLEIFYGSHSQAVPESVQPEIPRASETPAQQSSSPDPATSGPHSPPIPRSKPQTVASKNVAPAKNQKKAKTKTQGAKK